MGSTSPQHFTAITRRRAAAAPAAGAPRAARPPLPRGFAHVQEGASAAARFPAGAALSAAGLGFRGVANSSETAAGQGTAEEVPARHPADRLRPPAQAAPVTQGWPRRDRRSATAAPPYPASCGASLRFLPAGRGL